MMENLHVMLNILNNFGLKYFIKKCMFKKITRLIPSVLMITLSIIFFVLSVVRGGWTFFYFGAILLFCSATLLNHCIKKDFSRCYIKYPGTLKLLDKRNIGVEMFLITEKLRAEGLFTRSFVNKVLQECKIFYELNNLLSKNSILDKSFFYLCVTISFSIIAIVLEHRSNGIFQLKVLLVIITNIAIFLTMITMCFETKNSKIKHLDAIFQMIEMLYFSHDEERTPFSFHNKPVAFHFNRDTESIV